MPVPAAAPALASALGAETDPRARAQMAVALVACGGPAAADVVAGLQSDPEPLVRLSALDALCSLADRAADALRVAARDDSPAVRRRAAAIASSLGLEEIRAGFAMDAEGSVRAASTLRELPAPPPMPAPVVETVPARARSAAVRAARRSSPPAVSPAVASAWSPPPARAPLHKEVLSGVHPLLRPPVRRSAGTFPAGADRGRDARRPGAAARGGD